jgi:hypothetical protein
VLGPARGILGVILPVVRLGGRPRKPRRRQANVRLTVEPEFQRNLGSKEVNGLNDHPRNDPNDGVGL